ncbi:hypothetical protein POVWA2_022500 [Plasmodium ovale wallikeri]|uniref:Uncharacterized protein n=1 Tax=Plasmodium ovale wallikeri TaxID=864142 RepID=A0A1A8YSI1_PLAOA|nr:hypothetical protein POVWA1_022700 [Plasmodium ovale wallikeri]SBT34936.1 hypothetical protein POVWA2_022500 [Plasmodium ovale wallikeri]
MSDLSKNHETRMLLWRNNCVRTCTHVCKRSTSIVTRCSETRHLDLYADPYFIFFFIFQKKYQLLLRHPPHVSTTLQKIVLCKIGSKKKKEKKKE